VGGMNPALLELDLYCRGLRLDARRHSAAAAPALLDQASVLAC